MTTGFIEGKEQLFDIRQESRAFFPMKVGLCMLFCCLCAKRFVLLCFPPKACQKFWNSSPIGHDQVNTWGDSDLELCSVTEPSLENSPLSIFSPHFSCNKRLQPAALHPQRLTVKPLESRVC